MPFALPYPRAELRLSWLLRALTMLGFGCARSADGPAPASLTTALPPHAAYLRLAANGGMTVGQPTATGAKSAGSRVGLATAPIQNLTLAHLAIAAQTGLVLQNATGVAMSSYTIATASGPPVLATNAQGTGF